MKFLIYAVTFLSLLSCEKSKDEKSEPQDDGTAEHTTLGSLAIGTQVSQNLNTVDSNLEVVQTDLGPPPLGALNVSAGETQQKTGLNLVGSNATEVKERVKGSVEGTMRALGWVRGVINNLQPQIEGRSEKTGTIDMGFSKISFQFDAANKYKIRDIGGEGGNYHIEVDGAHYLLYRTPPKNAEPHTVGDNKIEVTFVDEENWNLRDDNTWSDCNANRPEILTTYVERKEGIWYGKFAFGNGSIHFKCPVEPAGMAYNYYQFVGHETEMTAAGYEGVPLAFTDFTKIEDYAYKDAQALTLNPICLKENVDPLPRKACESDVSAISTANYGLQDKWVSPDAITKILVSFPKD